MIELEKLDKLIYAQKTQGNLEKLRDTRNNLNKFCDILERLNDMGIGLGTIILIIYILVICIWWGQRSYMLGKHSDWRDDITDFPVACPDWTEESGCARLSISRNECKNVDKGIHLHTYTETFIEEHEANNYTFYTGRDFQRGARIIFDVDDND